MDIGRYDDSLALLEEVLRNLAAIKEQVPRNALGSNATTYVGEMRASNALEDNLDVEELVKLNIRRVLAARKNPVAIVGPSGNVPMPELAISSQRQPEL